MTTLPSTVARRVGEGIGPEPSEAGFRLAKEGKLGEDKTVLALLRRRNNATVVERVADATEPRIAVFPPLAHATSMACEVRLALHGSVASSVPKFPCEDTSALST